MSDSQSKRPEPLSEAELDQREKHATRLIEEAQRALIRLEQKTRVTIIQPEPDEATAH
jgi:hypothetical protein